MKTKYLSNAERERGLRHLFTWSTLNGMGFSFLGDTPISLMAIHFGASNLQLGYLSSIIHVSGVALLFVPRLLAGQNLVNVQFYSWLGRGLVCGFYLILFALEGQPAVIAILSIYTLFCAVRTVGVAVSPQIQQMLTTPATTGDVVVQLSNRFQVTRIASQLLSFMLLSIKQLTGLPGYLTLLGIGLATNTCSALELRKIPCREVIEYRRGGHIFTMFRRAMQDRERALTLIVKWHVLSISILLGFSIPFLRKIVHFPSSLIFLYTVVGSLASILAGSLLRPFADRLGSRPILTISSTTLVGVAILWGMLPPTLSWNLYFVLGFVTTFLQTTISLLSSRLDLRIIPEKDKMGYVSMMNFSAALVSLAVGLSGGMLADFGETLLIPGLNSFGLTFWTAAVLIMQNSILCFFLKDPGSWSIKDTLEILFSTNNLKTYLDAYQFNLTEDRAKRTFLLMSLGKSDTPIALDEMQQILQSPLSMEKEDVLKTLFVHPKPALLPDILREAADPYSYHRMTALFALGAYPAPQVEHLLLTLLDDPSLTVQSTAAKSLARIGNVSALPRIKTLAANPALGITEQMNYLIAISLMDKAGTYLRDLFQVVRADKGETFEQTMFALAAKMLDVEPPLAEIYQDENDAPGTGLRDFLQEAKQLEPFFQYAATLAEDYAAGRYRELWEWAQKSLAHLEVQGRFVYLKEAITNCANTHPDQTNALAVLYFTYHILLAHELQSSANT